MLVYMEALSLVVKTMIGQQYLNFADGLGLVICNTYLKEDSFKRGLYKVLEFCFEPH